ncbi:MAG: NusG domain II-containing protein [Nitrospirae bacterium]|nr:NusG domain II-containing protein [Nitrospirota bacterium]
MSLRETINGTTRADRLLFVLLVLFSLCGLVFIKEVLPQSREVKIEVEGKLAYRYPLDTERVVDITSPSGRLTVEIKDGRVRVTHATCPNKLCEHQGWIRAGAIICLPGRISVLVGGFGGGEDDNVDAVTG